MTPAQPVQRFFIDALPASRPSVTDPLAVTLRRFETPCGGMSVYLFRTTLNPLYEIRSGSSVLALTDQSHLTGNRIGQWTCFTPWPQTTVELFTLCQGDDGRFRLEMPGKGAWTDR